MSGFSTARVNGTITEQLGTNGYGPYYEFFYKWPILTFSLPFLAAVVAFYSALQIVLLRVKGRKYRLTEKKLQSPRVQYFLSFLLRTNALILGVASNVVTLVYGRFENEFIRVCIVAMVQLFSFYAD